MTSPSLIASEVWKIRINLAIFAFHILFYLFFFVRTTPPFEWVEEKGARYVPLMS